MTAQRLDTFRAIATAYRQYEFRSRLEAKYAAFFDLCGWPWSYEPVDFNGWIPDFAIGERPILVEVKPFFRSEEFGEAIAKIECSGCSQPVLLLGADPMWIAHNEEHCDAPCIGWILESPLADESGCQVREVWPINFGVTEGNGKIGLCSQLGAWWNIIWKARDSDPYANKWSRVELRGADIETELVDRWAKACNIAKWIPYAEHHRS